MSNRVCVIVLTLVCETAHFRVQYKVTNPNSEVIHYHGLIQSNTRITEDLHAQEIMESFRIVQKSTQTRALFHSSGSLET